MNSKNKLAPFIIVLFFFMVLNPAIGFVLLFIGVGYLIYKGNQVVEEDEETFDRPNKRGWVDSSEDAQFNEPLVRYNETIVYQEPEPEQEPHQVDLTVEDDGLEDEVVEELAEADLEVEQDWIDQDTSFDIEVPSVDAFETPTVETSRAFTEEIEDGDQGAKKEVVCSMCGTVNNIEKVDVFETPNCSNCGMLLLNYDA